MAGRAERSDHQGELLQLGQAGVRYVDEVVVGHFKPLGPEEPIRIAQVHLVDDRYASAARRGRIGGIDGRGRAVVLVAEHEDARRIGAKSSSPANLAIA